MNQALKDGAAPAELAEGDRRGRPRLQLADSFAAERSAASSGLPAPANRERPSPPAELDDAKLPTQWPEGEASLLVPSRIGLMRGLRGPVGSFLFVVLIPLIGLLFYLLVFAAPQYMAEFRFSVTEVSSGGSGGGSSAPAAGGGAMMSMASSMLGGGAMHSGSQQNYVVIDYLRSRQVIDELSDKIPLTDIFSRPSIDWWMRFNPAKPREKLLDYWSRMVTTNYDPITGLAKVEVVAFTPDDAYKVASTLMGLSEDLVNEISGRARDDTVRYAEIELARARKELEQKRADLAAFRLREGVIDPTQSVVTTNIQVGATLQTTLSQLQADLATLKQQNIDEKSPASQSVLARIRATRQELQGVEREVANDRVGRETLAKLVAQYDRLEVDRQYAQSTVLTAQQGLDRARLAASTQHLYLTPYVKPAIPTAAIGPANTKIMVFAALGLFAIWLVGLLLFRSVRQSAA